VLLFIGSVFSYCYEAKREKTKKKRVCPFDARKKWRKDDYQALTEAEREDESGWNFRTMIEKDE
jgi:hypothetical protein